MNIIIGFSPWVLFWVLSAHHSLIIAAGISLALSLAVNLRSYLKGRPKILEIGSFVFLFSMTLLSLFTYSYAFWRWFHVMVNTALFLTSLFSILAGRPFIFQYVREEVPNEKKNSPELYRTCLTITRVWTVLFLVMIFTATAKVFWEHPVQWIIIGGHTILFMGAMVFTRLYRKRAGHNGSPFRSGRRSTAFGL
jgi:uncharacterized membrane protein